MTTALLLFFLCVQRQKKTKCLCHVYTLKLPDALLMLPALSLIIKGCFWPPTRSFCLYVWVFESISGEATVTVTEDWLKANGLWWYLLLFKDNSPDDRHLNLRQWKSTLRRRILCCRPERSQPPPASPLLTYNHWVKRGHCFMICVSIRPRNISVCVICLSWCHTFFFVFGTLI